VLGIHQKSWWQAFKDELPTRVERKKIVPLTIMFFCMLFNYTILRDTKDVLVVTAPKSGRHYWHKLSQIIGDGICVFIYNLFPDAGGCMIGRLKVTLNVCCHAGAEVIPFLKTYVNLPAAVLLTIIYSKLCNAMPMSKVFYTLLTPFLFFFAAFAWIIYPNRDALHPHATADYLTTVLPRAFKGPISIFRNWTYAVFYTMAELWWVLITL